MPNQAFSVHTITALTDVITGGAAGAGQGATTPGVYRSGSRIRQFFGGLNIEIFIGSRVPSVREKLDELNWSPDGLETITRVIEAVSDPREYGNAKDTYQEVFEYLNQKLRPDGYEIREVGGRTRLLPLGSTAPVATALHETADSLNFDSVVADFERAMKDAETDPAGAITAACSTVESVCKSLLDEMDVAYPAKQDIQGLTREVAKRLDLSPGQPDLPSESEAEIRTILQGLANCAQGIGALRTKAGDAHGRGKNVIAADARTARLAIHAASTISLFYIETWKRASEAE
ncbi:MAG TPA: abortive infection family protein [Phycisphaerae bacterium]|nr:abortive infection family protein [Phycisphaerae bacterium]